MKQTAWNVYLDDELIDTVFYDENCDKDYVLRSLIEHDNYAPDIEIRLGSEKPEFFCHPTRAFAENDDGTPAEVNECDLAEAQWVSVYRTNPDHATTDKMPSEWVLDLDAGHSWLSREQTLRVAKGLVELLKGITPVEALHNPKLHVFFE